MPAISDTSAEFEDVLNAIQDGMIDELSESEARFRAVIENVVDAVVTISECGVIDFANLAAERMFGYPHQDLVGKNISLIVPAAMTAECGESVAGSPRVKRSPLVGANREAVGKRVDGSEFPLEMSIGEVFILGRRFFTGILRDVTERRRLEDQLRAAEQAAVADSQAKSEFLRSMNHHLRTPLTPILGYAELLLEEELSEHQQELVAGIQRNAQQLLSEVSRLLDSAYEFAGSTTVGGLIVGDRGGLTHQH